MGQVLWQVMPGEGMVSEPTVRLRLVVVPTVAPKSFRFVVEDRATGESTLLPVLSGYRESVAAAMQAAEDAAGRIGAS